MILPSDVYTFLNFGSTCTFRVESFSLFFVGLYVTLIAKVLRCKKYENIRVSKGQIKTCTRRIFNTLDINSRLLDFLILLVAIDIHLNLCPSSS